MRLLVAFSILVFHGLALTGCSNDGGEAENSIVAPNVPTSHAMVTALPTHRYQNRGNRHIETCPDGHPVEMLRFGIQTASGQGSVRSLTIANFNGTYVPGAQDSMLPSVSLVDGTTGETLVNGIMAGNQCTLSPIALNIESGSTRELVIFGNIPAVVNYADSGHLLRLGVVAAEILDDQDKPLVVDGLSNDEAGIDQLQAGIYGEVIVPVKFQMQFFAMVIADNDLRQPGCVLASVFCTSDNFDDVAGAQPAVRRFTIQFRLLRHQVGDTGAAQPFDVATEYQNFRLVNDFLGTPIDAGICVAGDSLTVELTNPTDYVSAVVIADPAPGNTVQIGDLVSYGNFPEKPFSDDSMPNTGPYAAFDDASTTPHPILNSMLVYSDGADASAGQTDTDRMYIGVAPTTECVATVSHVFCTDNAVGVVTENIGAYINGTESTINIGWIQTNAETMDLMYVANDGTSGTLTAGILPPGPACADSFLWRNIPASLYGKIVTITIVGHRAGSPDVMASWAPITVLIPPPTEPAANG